MNQKHETTQIKPIKRTKKNIEKIVQELTAMGWNPKFVFLDEIIEGRLKGFTPNNCKHPPGKFQNNDYMEYCLQCGYFEPYG